MRPASSLIFALSLLGSAMAAQAAESVLVFGGSGQLGSEVVKAVAAKGDKVTVFVRPTSKLDLREGVKVDRIDGDVMKEADVAAAFKKGKFTVVVDALANDRGGPANFYEMSEVHISKAVKSAGVKQLILHSSVGAGDSRSIYPQDRLADMVAVLDSKGLGEKAAVGSGVNYTIIRNAALREAPGPEQAKIYEDHTKFGAVSRKGLGRLTAECVGNPACNNKIYHAVDDTIPLRAR